MRVIRFFPLSGSVLLVLGQLWAFGQPAEPSHEQEPAPAAAPLAPLVEPHGVMDDRQILSHLTAFAKDLLDCGRAVSMETLIEQLRRKSCQLELPRPSWRKPSAAKLVTKCQPGVLVLGHLYKCKTCPCHHIRISTGFILTRSGAAAAAYHAVHSPEDLTIVAMTGDGKMVPVREVLAANEQTDVAILQLESGEYTALSLGRQMAPVGTGVRILSHPDNNFFALSGGLLARYFVFRNGPGEITMMAVTADFAKGSSGAPLLDEHGTVIGMASTTRSIYYNTQSGRRDDLQMVLKHCVPAEYVRALVRRK